MKKFFEYLFWIHNEHAKANYAELLKSSVLLKRFKENRNETSKSST